jgi:threonine dehydrogenase-like Zn-dependent dehydrogenase
MRALTFTDGAVRYNDVAEPELLEPTDAIVRVRAAGICGSDLHLIHERVPGLRDGSVLGHEAVGIVEAVGAKVTSVRPGDRVIASFLIACGACWSCERNETNQCEDLRALGYGMFLGDLDGAQAERVRIPVADVNLLALPAHVSDDAGVFVGDILTTGVYIAERSGVAAGSSVSVVGAGPVGLMTILAAHARGAGTIYAIDLDPSRLELAAQLGAIPVDAGARDPVVAIQKATGERGTDVVIECVGASQTLLTALDLVRPNGTVGVIGVHVDLEVAFPLGEVWRKGVRIEMGATCPVHAYWREALDLVASGTIDPTLIVTDRVALADGVEAYRRFDSREALKVILEP